MTILWMRIPSSPAQSEAMAFINSSMLKVLSSNTNFFTTARLLPTIHGPMLDWEMTSYLHPPSFKVLPSAMQLSIKQEANGSAS